MVFSGIASGLWIVGGGIAIAILATHLLHRCFSDDTLRKSHDVTGNLLAIVGTLYAVLLGLVVVDAMMRFEQAMDTVQKESNCLADIFLLAKRLPEPHGPKLCDLCRGYAYEVVDKEWPLMARGRVSQDARRAALAIARGLEDFEPVTESQKTVYPLVLEQVRELWDHRRERCSTAEFGIPAVEWFVLLIGAAVLVLLVGLFAVENGWLRVLLPGVVALVLALNLYLLSLFGYPFAGDLSVSNRPFQVDIGIFEGRYDATPAHAGESDAAPR
jgi:hypothetical protein